MMPSAKALRLATPSCPECGELLLWKHGLGAWWCRVHGLARTGQEVASLWQRRAGLVFFDGES